MNLINKLLFLIIIIFLINHLTNGQISETIKRYLMLCQDKIENFTGLTLFNNKKYLTMTDFACDIEANKNLPYLNSNDINNLDDEMYSFYRFINNMVTPNINTYELKSSRTKKIQSDSALNQEILNQMNKIFNSKGYKFNNIKLIDNIFYYENKIGKDFEPFNFTADITYREKYLGKVLINIELFLREDKFFYKPMKTGFLSIINIRLLDITYPDNKKKTLDSDYKIHPKSQSSLINGQVQTHLDNKPINYEASKTEQKAIIHTQNLANKMNEQFNEHFVDREDYDDLFIKPDNKFVTDSFMNDLDNSLIPSIVNLSTCEPDSIAETTQ